MTESEFSPQIYRDKAIKCLKKAKRQEAEKKKKTRKPIFIQVDTRTTIIRYV